MNTFKKRFITPTILCRSYHSYPDPNEVPIISSFKSAVTKQLDKSQSPFNLDKKFRLDKAFPGIPITSGNTSSQYPKTYVSKLDNGITVASQDLPSLMSSFTVIVGAGSSNEVQDDNHLESTQGATHAIELTAFRNTTNRKHDQLLKEIENIGGTAQCVSSRESILYCVDVLRENHLTAIDILADAVLNPTYDNDDIEVCQNIMKLQINEFPGEILTKDAVQIGGYKNYPLGCSHFCPENKVNVVSKELIERFRKSNYFGENVVVAAAGIDHETFKSIISEKFKDLPSLGNEKWLQFKSNKMKSVYTGGMYKNERELKEPFIRIALGFEIGGWHDPQFVPACVLQQLLGGGSSFSAGGPGKGMYTRLYTQALNKHHWVESAEAFVSVHNESGIFGIDGSCMPEYSINMIQVSLDHLVRLAFEPVSDEELNRAKNMLRSMMMMQLESRLVVCEDIARQISTFGQRELPMEVSKKIESVTKEDLLSVARRMVISPPVIGCVGNDLSLIPSYDDINIALEPLRMKLKSQFVLNKKLH